MDTKELWLLERTLATLQSGSYSERDVLALLILLRAHAADKSPIREFGDFVAHRRKDRGILQTFLGRVRSALLNPPPVGVQPSSISFPVYTSATIHAALNDVFAALGLSSMDVELANQIMVCVISLFQSVEVETEPNTPVHGFAVGISSTNIALLGHGTVKAGHVFDFPLLVAENNGYERSLAVGPRVQFLMRCDLIVEAYCSGGKFAIEQRRRAA